MSFNLKQSQKINNSVTPISKAVMNNTEKYNLSLDKGDAVNFNSRLESDRRPIESPQTHEAMLDERRKKSVKSERITEGELGEVDSPLYPHRQEKDADGFSVAPVNAMSEAFDRKYRDAFAKKNKGADTAFWDKYIGVQMDDAPTKVSNNVPSKGSQLHANPDRFENIDAMPTDSIAEVNRDNMNKEVKIKPMHGYSKGEKALKMALSSLQDADKLLFYTYLQAEREGRGLTGEEKELVNGINRDKISILKSFAQIVPGTGKGDFMAGEPDDQQYEDYSYEQEAQDYENPMGDDFGNLDNPLNNNDNLNIPDNKDIWLDRTSQEDKNKILNDFANKANSNNQEGSALGSLLGGSPLGPQGAIVPEDDGEYPPAPPEVQGGVNEGKNPVQPF